HDSYIITPDELVYKDIACHTPCGYRMQALPAPNFSVAQYVNKIFKERHGITPEKTTNLIETFKQSIINIHKNSILLVDINEFNFVTNATFDHIYCIDVDSYIVGT